MAMSAEVDIHHSLDLGPAYGTPARCWLQSLGALLTKWSVATRYHNSLWWPFHAHYAIFLLILLYFFNRLLDTCTGCIWIFPPENILVGHRFTSKVFMLSFGILVGSKLLKQPDNVWVTSLGGGVCCGPASWHSFINMHTLCNQPAHWISSEIYFISRTPLCEKSTKSYYYEYTVIWTYLPFSAAVMRGVQPLSKGVLKKFVSCPCLRWLFMWSTHFFAISVCPRFMNMLRSPTPLLFLFVGSAPWFRRTSNATVFLSIEAWNRRLHSPWNLSVQKS